MTENGSRFPERLKALGYPVVELDDKDIREVGKISNYWRISRHLTKCSRRFRLHFADASWHAIQSYIPSSKSRIQQRRFVHAEIQLVAYYENIALQHAPRTLGVSKEACFLCDSFIRAHSLFRISGAHRQIVSQWTVPDLEQYSLQTILRFRSALSTVCADVNKEYVRSQEKRPWQPFPLQSAINLDVVYVPTPSVSTLYDQQSTNSAGASSVHITSSTSRGCHTRQGVRINGKENKDRFVDSSTENLQQCENHSDNEHEPDELPVDITVDKEVSSCVDWINIIATCTSSSNSQTSNPLFSGLISRSISIGPVSSIGRQRIVCLEDIPIESGLTLTRDGSDAPNEILFVLAGQQGKEIQIRCQWGV